MQRPESTRDWQELELRVLELVRRSLGPRLRRRLESHDVAQDVLLAIHRDVETHDPTRTRDFMDWVAGVVRNRIRNLADYHGAARRTPEREASLGGVLPEHADAGPGPDEAAVLRHDMVRLVRALEQLDEDQRQLILLREYEGRSWTEIARACGKPTPDAARMAHARALARVATRFEDGPGRDR